MKLVEKSLIDIARPYDAQANSLCYGLHAIRIVQTLGIIVNPKNKETLSSPGRFFAGGKSS